LQHFYFVQVRETILSLMAKARLSYLGSRTDLEFLARLNLARRCEEDVLTVLVGHTVLRRKACRRSHKHHPVTLVLVTSLVVRHLTRWLLYLGTSQHMVTFVTVRSGGIRITCLSCTLHLITILQQ